MILKAYRFYLDLPHELYPELLAQKRLLGAADITPIQELITTPDDVAIQTYVPNLIAEGNFNTWQARVDFAAFDEEKALTLADPFTQRLAYSTRDPDMNNRPLTRFERHGGYCVFSVQYQFRLRP